MTVKEMGPAVATRRAFFVSVPRRTGGLYHARLHNKLGYGYGIIF
jgi:hypothetical protein